MVGGQLPTGIFVRLRSRLRTMTVMGWVGVEVSSAAAKTTMAVMGV